MSDETPVRTPGTPPAARRWLVFLAATAVLGTALYLVAQPASRIAAVAPGAAPDPEPAAAPEPAILADAPEAEADAVATAAQDVLAAPVPQALLDAPGFDLVRVAPDGGAVVAGHAAPGATVTIYADATPLAEVEADAQGNFVAIFTAEPAAVPQALTLGAAVEDGEEILSEDVVLLLPEAPVPDTATPATTIIVGADPVEAVEVDAAEPDAAIELAMATPAEAAAPGPAPVPAAAPAELEGAADPDAGGAVEPAIAEAGVPAEAEAAGPPGASGEFGPRPRVAATAILRADGVEVVSGEPVSLRQVSLASISYASDGEVMLAGLGTAGARLRAYVDDGFAEEGEVGGDGRWSLALGDVDVGVYRLRIDQIDAEGQVASRVETPFQRDLPRGPMPRPGTEGNLPDGERPMQVTVQPGTNLWTLARVHYGAGVRYSQIFTANQHLIRDPDLIYPGQIFDLPDVDAEP